MAEEKETRLYGEIYRVLYKSKGRKAPDHHINYLDNILLTFIDGFIDTEGKYELIDDFVEYDLREEDEVAVSWAKEIDAYTPKRFKVREVEVRLPNNDSITEIYEIIDPWDLEHSVDGPAYLYIKGTEPGEEQQLGDDEPWWCY